MPRTTARKNANGMASTFFSKSKGVWIHQWTDGLKPNGKPHRPYVTGRTKAEAKEKG